MENSDFAGKFPRSHRTKWGYFGCNVPNRREESEFSSLNDWPLLIWPTTLWNYQITLNPYLRTGNHELVCLSTKYYAEAPELCCPQWEQWISLSENKNRSSHLFYRVVAVSQSTTCVRQRQMLVKFEYSEYTSLRRIRNKIFFSPKPQAHSSKNVFIDIVFKREAHTDYRQLLATFENNRLKMPKIWSQILNWCNWN